MLYKNEHQDQQTVKTTKTSNLVKFLNVLMFIAKWAYRAYKMLNWLEGGE